jgi:hypothetical protein
VRLALLAQLPEAVAALGVKLDLAGAVINACADDVPGDAIDALIACVTVQLVTRGLWAPPPLTGHAATRALIEGWIARPA